MKYPQNFKKKIRPMIIKDAIDTTGRIPDGYSSLEDSPSGIPEETI